MDEDSVWKDAWDFLEARGGFSMRHVWLWKTYEDERIAIGGRIENNKFVEMLISVKLAADDVVAKPKFGMSRHTEPDVTLVYQARPKKDSRNSIVEYSRPGMWIGYLHDKAEAERAKDKDLMALHGKDVDDSELFAELGD